LTAKKPRPSSGASRLRTEQQNSATRQLDQRSSLDIARIINAEDARVAPAIKKALPQICEQP
jgi:N-acetylmuramic acid 6-phosphate etherase